MPTSISNNEQQGFVLTRRAMDTRQGLELTYWLKTQAGPTQVKVIGEKAIFFVETQHAQQSVNLLNENQIRLSKKNDLPLKTFNQQPVTAFYFDLLKDFYFAREILKQHSIKCYEDDIRPEERYMMERFITSSLSFTPSDQLSFSHPQSNQTQSRHSKQYPSYKRVRCKTDEYDPSLTMISIDIECSPQGELYSIGAYSDDCQLVLMIGEPEPDSESYIQWVDDEIELLKGFIVWLNEYDPDIIIGWNVINFDFNLLQKRCELHQIPFRIGRDGSTPHWRQLKTSDQKFIEIAGRVILDGIDVLKTATYSFSSFSLENVSNELLGKSKKVTDVDNRLAEIIDNFNYNKQALAAYNLEDCVLVWQIFEKTHLLSFSKLRASLTGLSLDRVGGSVAAFTNLYLPKLHRAGYIAPNLGDGKSDLVSPGGHVMDSIPGLYNNVLVLDFKSLYPSIIRTFQIDPMGLIEGLKSPDNAIVGYDGALFSRDKNFLPDIITELWQERDKAKADQDAALSQAIKIIMNSFYGVLGSTGCRFFDPRLSGSITKRSHSILKTTKEWIEDLGHQVIYGDTDSIFVFVGNEQSPASCQLLGKDLASYINDKWSAIIENEHQVVSQLEIEFETHFSKFFMPTIRGQGAAKELNNIGTKKRYAGMVDGKLKFKGLETVRSDWTDISKVFQQELYRRVFEDIPVKQYIQVLVDDIRAGKHDKALVYRKKLRRKLEDYANTPPHIKAAKLGNEVAQEKGQKIKYKRGSKIEYVISVTGVVPVDLISSSLDYDYYIEKQIKPIADDILPFINEDFDDITSQQLGLF
ncbi:DNA polymerase II [Thalassotalea atypica]|uniref:DNA polymerase II n=1 Tax=Thalassotalea atypica TaxID=2054316 RepID=UPI0025747701|nr:DNA polymerase II [Thalassotalea atypica]